MGHLHISTFGAPKVLHDDQILTFSTRKEIAVLLYLAVEGGMHSRKKLTDLLWPESDALRGRAAFRITLSRLREALSEQGTQTESAHLVIERGMLGLDMRSDITLDLHTLNVAWTLARSLTSESEKPALEDQRNHLLQLEQAVNLVHDTFLAGFSLRDAPAFDDWIRLQREHWLVRLRQIFDNLSILQETSGKQEQAIETVTRWAAFDPLHEECYLRLMRLYEAQGNRSAALHAYETCCAIFATELSTAPSLSTTALAERLRSSRATFSREQASGRPSVATLLQAPLIGREHELAMLIEVYLMVQGVTGQARTQVMLLEGEAGIGKTRLAQEFVAWARAQGAQVLTGRTFEMGGRLPYQPLISALRPQLDAENAPEDLLADVWLAELTRLWPELRDRYPDLPVPAPEEGVARTHMFEAVARLMQAWASRTPMVLWLDDLHWADAASLDLLVYLIGRWRESTTPILLLLSLRSEAVNSTPSLAQWRTDVGHGATITSLVLAPLNTQETLHLVETLIRGTQTDTSKRFGQWIYQETAGQPFYLLEMLKVLLDRHIVAPHRSQDGQWTLNLVRPIEGETMLHGVVPPGVRDTIRARLGQLSPLASSLLLAGAVLGPYSTFDLLCAVAGVSEHDGLIALDDVLPQRFLVEEHRRQAGGGDTFYIFSHDKIREVVYGEANVARLRIFHRRAFEMLKIVGASAAEIAHHAQKAMLMDEAFRWSMHAGDEAMAVFAIQDVVKFYEQAKALLLPIANQQDFAPGASVQHLFLQLGRAYALLQQWKAAQQEYEALQTYAEQNHDERLRCIALNHLIQMHTLNDAQIGHMRDLLYQARQAAEACDDEALLKETLWNEFQQGGAAWDQMALAAWGEQKDQRIQEVQNYLVVAQHMTGFAYDNPQMTHWEQAQASAEQAIVWYQQQGNMEMEAHSWGLLSAARLQQDNVPEAIRTMQQAQILTEQCGSIYGLNIDNGFQAYLQFLRGNYEVSWGLMQRVIPQARRFGFIPQLIADLFVFVDLHLLFNQYEQAIQIAQEGLQLSKRLESRGDIELLASRLCLLHAQRDEWSQAVIFAEQAQAARDDYALPLFLVPSLYETEAWLRAGKHAEAEREIERLEKRLGNNRRYRIFLLQSRAVLTQWDGKIEQAREHLREAAHLAEALEMRGELWDTQARLGDLFQRLGDEMQAQQAYEQAATIVRNLADRIGDEALRAHFLASSRVRHVLER